MAHVLIQNVRKSYENLEVIHGANIEISDGEFVVLVGPSGCGKSTLLRMIAGLETISSGEIILNGTVVNDTPPKGRDIAMVFQNYALYPHMKVRDNLSFSLKLQKVDRAAIDQQVESVAEILDLTPYLDRYPRQLSGGQRQRVAMGRAIVRKPQVFLFDEPLSNLDAKLRVQMRAEIKALHRRLKTTMIFVTHDQVEAMTMADKIVVMRDGIVEQVGAPLDLYDRPVNQFVASFIGSPSMNMIDGTVQKSGDGLIVDTACGQLPLAGNPSVKVGQKIIYGIRPEHLELAETGLEAEVVMIEMTGAETHILLQMGAREVSVLFRERHNFKLGQTICVKPMSDWVHIFDFETGCRI